MIQVANLPVNHICLSTTMLQRLCECELAHCLPVEQCDVHLLIHLLQHALHHHNTLTISCLPDVLQKPENPTSTNTITHHSSSSGSTQTII